MTWTDFYLICFFVGLLLSVVSVFSGFLHIPGFDLGHHGVFHIDFHADAGVDAGHVDGSSHAPYFNFASIMAFITWFGGTGYLLRKHGAFWGGWEVLLSIGSGLVGAMLVFLFISKFVMPHSHELEEADYDRVGVIGQVTSAVRAGGTGEILFVQENVRNVCGARSETGEALAQGTEVVIIRYENGIAYVRRWEELEASVNGHGEASDDDRGGSV